MDFDFDFETESLVPIALALLGAFVAYFTSVGGFSSLVTGEAYNPGGFVKITAPLLGGVIGYVWGYYMTR